VVGYLVKNVMNLIQIVSVKERIIMTIERTEIGIGKMRIDVVDDQAVYINLNGYTYYVDDTTDEQIIKKWKDEE
jgi:hypothetical protein